MSEYLTHASFAKKQTSSNEETQEDILLDAELNGLLSFSDGNEIQRNRQVYVNRNLRMSNIKLVGFDMDYTLAIYQKRTIEKLSFDMTLKRLIETRGYPANINQLVYDPFFIIRGLCIDRALGNLLKMDQYYHVGRACHGRHLLSKIEKKRLYREEKINIKSKRFAWIDTLFALPEACLYADIVDWMSKHSKKIDFDRLYVDIRESIDEVHRDNSLKQVICSNLEQFIVQDPELGPTLHQLRLAGKKIFLLTNSAWDYTNTVMCYLLDDNTSDYPSWRNYFDVVVCSAQKPEFFTSENPFWELDTATGRRIRRAELFEPGRIYEGGNLVDFENKMKIGGEFTLYIGDHIYGDILRSKKSSLWRTCMIVEELEEEVANNERLEQKWLRLAKLELFRSRLDREIRFREKEFKVLESMQGEKYLGLCRMKEELERLHCVLQKVVDEAENLEDSVEAQFNPFWGLLFKEGTEKSRFGKQVEEYACIYTSRVSNLLGYSPFQYFRSPRDFLPHEQSIKSESY